jgi:hypothetical protein
MVGKGQPPPAARPSLPIPQQPGVKRGGRSAATEPLSPPTSQSSQQHTPPPATVLHDMFSTCVARGIAAKLVYKTVGGKVETSLFCSTAVAAPAAATSVSQKKGRKRPDNERRKMRREAWFQRRCVSQAEIVKAVSSAAAATVSEEEFSAAAASSTHESAAPGTVSTAPATAAAAAMPPQAWAWENRHGLLLTARRIWMDQSHSPETARASEVGGDLNLSTSSWTEDREDDCSGRESPPTAKTATAPAPAVPGQEAPRETSPTAEDGVEKRVEPVLRPPPTPPPWSKYFLCHYRRVLCTFCFAGNREIWNAKCSDCYRQEREEFKKLKDCKRK